MLRTVLHIVPIAAFFGLLISCDIFEPRTPEEPTAARGNFIPPTTSDIVIENFINAINERNAQHYVQCFADPALTERAFEFIPTQRAQGQFAALFEEWDVQDERMYFENLISSIPDNATLNLSLHNDQFESQSSDAATFVASYILTAEHTNEGFPYFIFEGTLRFELSTDQANNWSIFRWADLPSGEQRSWSELKGTFKL